MTSILKERPDGFGYFYGMYGTHTVNVRQDRAGGHWYCFVDGNRVPNESVVFPSKAEAEAAARAWIDDPHGGAR